LDCGAFTAAFLPAGTKFSPLFKVAKCDLDSGSHPVTNCDRFTESPTTGSGAGKFAVRNLV
jgi:hypothetical protein